MTTLDDKVRSKMILYNKHRVPTAMGKSGQNNNKIPGLGK